MRFLIFIFIVKEKYLLERFSDGEKDLQDFYQSS